MRAPLSSIAVGLAGLCVGLSAQAQPFNPPARRPGYWQSTMSMSGGGQARSYTMQMCTDPTIEKSFSVMGNGMADKNCSQHEFHPIPGGWAFNSTCTVAGATDVSSGTVTGDFQSGYHMEMTTHSSTGQTHHSTIDSKWMGPCPPGRAPGDMVMPGGMVMNMATGRMAHMGGGD